MNLEKPQQESTSKNDNKVHRVEASNSVSYGNQNKPKQKYCYFYTNGRNCKFGQQCRFLHERAPMCKAGMSCQKDKCMYTHPIPHQNNHQKSFLYHNQQ